MAAAAAATAGVAAAPAAAAAMALRAPPAVAVAGLLVSLARPTPTLPVIRYLITLPEDQRPLLSGQGQFGTSLTLSADGSRLVYVGSTETGGSRLLVKERDQLDARPIPGTEEAHQPALSPRPRLAERRRTLPAPGAAHPRGRPS